MEDIEMVELGQTRGEDPSSEFNGKQNFPGERTLDNYRFVCRDLLKAALEGDWPAAERFLEESRGLDYVRTPITNYKGTVLHVAVNAQRTTFVEELLKWMKATPEDLELQTTGGYTALHYAAQSGIVRIAEQLVEINDRLLVMPDYSKDRETPLNVAAFQGHANMISYLLSQTPLDRLTSDNSTNLLLWTIRNDLYDIALKILEEHPNMATAAGTESGWRTETCTKALKLLARKPFPIGSESDQLPFWKTLLKNSRFKGIYDKALMKTNAHRLVDELWKKVIIQKPQFSSELILSHSTLLFEAAEVGNVEFIIIIARSYPELLWQLDENEMSIFHFAIKHRHENVFNLIYEMGANKDSLTTYLNSKTDDNMLHLAGELPHSDRVNIVSGAALQMQRELLWFKEIEKIVPKSFVNEKNKGNETPKEIFIKTHANLQKNGEKWMKVTANYCMLVATLIATVIFAAAFTVPGGSDEKTGIPNFLRRTWFKVFFISDAIALCSSSTSIVIFLSILTSRYTEEDFLVSLPSKLVFGLVTLFISMMGMMVAFIATYILVYTSASAQIRAAVVITLAIPPIAFFLQLHLKLWVDTLFSTCTSRFLFQPKNHRLF
ncbi:ankyrin repeat-containing protein ITN1-like [Alnus glutinosa]|uniref:ankyrin repeat-containing protein ITN1-like n=1 Tax=Alnus glutinosa TaxID=3517 RepID=UPI002D78E925|nr:ankyrin repeat-containing protein ITN1-like [Alnus glutinosa]